MKKQLTLAFVAAVVCGSAFAQDAAKPVPANKAVSPNGQATLTQAPAARSLHAVAAPQRAASPAKATAAPVMRKSAKPAETPDQKNK